MNKSGEKTKILKRGVGYIEQRGGRLKKGGGV